MDSGVHPSLCFKCHHPVIYAILNLQIEYPTSYTHEVWDYDKAQFDLIHKAIENFDWNELYSSQGIHNQVNLFNTTILNIFRNFISNKLILCDDKESPWANDEVWLFIKRKRQSKNDDFDIGILNKLSEDLTNATTISKLAYHRRIAPKLNDPNSASKT